ncbi:PREDICTED: 28S ribosomal protein S7, mitochondrial [Nicrophorus vespilloides]|uniref:28S ribosomal protein S7, mitochondrial n=1 Tax=Nicrophorus vespilloides TaxID=110193 RepID=A0ABM1NJB9_NICVS|nr:PREDICTED: 28S ribosomal protein S7, mitochondrial [Nicrophorus vespilloides]
MALVKTLANLKSVQILTNKLAALSVVQQNGMSMYPPYYINPIFKKDAQVELFENGEAQKLAHIPTKAALIDQTCSIYYDDDIRLFRNYIMRSGRKSLARELLDKAFEKVKRSQLEKFHKAKTEEDKNKIVLDPREVFHMAVDNCKPVLFLTPIKRGGVKYQVPVPITEKKSQFLSMKWLIEAATDKERTVHFPEKLAYELIDASNNTGRVVKRKQDLHRQCEANRAYAHYRWS